MIKLQPDNAEAYLAQLEAAPPGPWTVTPLGGGVSNTVLRVESPYYSFVLKQALAQLRVKEVWLADPGRIRRECAALRLLQPHMPQGSLPAVVFEDAANYIFALEAAPKTASDWKTLLLGGVTRVEHAQTAAEILRALASAHSRDADLAAQFEDQTSFDQLRLDPYYRFTATRHADVADAFEEAIARCRRRLALVHGDFSPKNFLVTGERMLLIDFEVIHLGDPAFDAAFMLNHLLLKVRHGIGACRELAREFWRGLGGTISEPDTILHLGCLHLARVDGKSPAEYLTPDEQTQVRGFARELIRNPPRTVEEIFA